MLSIKAALEGDAKDLLGVIDAGLSERSLEAKRVGPGVLRPANAAALAHVEHDTHVGVVQSSQKAIECPAVDTDRGDLHRVDVSRRGSEARRARAARG